MSGANANLGFVYDLNENIVFVMKTSGLHPNPSMPAVTGRPTGDLGLLAGWTAAFISLDIPVRALN